MIKKKFCTLIAAFRSFDRNGDGSVNRKEFGIGLKNSGPYHISVEHHGIRLASCKSKWIAGMRGVQFVTHRAASDLISGVFPGLDLPPSIIDRIWAMADTDGTGTLAYQEFARKFAAYKVFR